LGAKEGAKANVADAGCDRPRRLDQGRKLGTAVSAVFAICGMSHADMEVSVLVNGHEVIVDALRDIPASASVIPSCRRVLANHRSVSGALLRKYEIAGEFGR